MKETKEICEPPGTDFCSLDYDCAYLPDRSVRMFYRHTSEATGEFCGEVIRRGWRRFGNYYFYPICQGCTECKSLRIRVSDFRPSRSQKKAVKRNADTVIRWGGPSVSAEHLRLYDRYHRWKAQKDGWSSRDIGFREYFENFAEGAHDFGKESLYFRDNRLIGVDLIDIVSDGISSIYFYYDPDYAWYSPGTFSLLKQIELASFLGLKYVYLGYWVNGCKAFAYKSRFRPLEILDGFPSMHEEPQWREFEDEI